VNYKQTRKPSVAARRITQKFKRQSKTPNKPSAGVDDYSWNKQASQPTSLAFAQVLQTVSKRCYKTLYNTYIFILYKI
jgi:hypothetical protein